MIVVKEKKLMKKCIHFLERIEWNVWNYSIIGLSCLEVSLLCPFKYYSVSDSNETIYVSIRSM